MRNALFNKAAKLIAENKVRFEYESERQAHFTVVGSKEEHQVILFYEDYTLKHSCDCFNMTQNGDPTRMCSHKLACITYRTTEALVKLSAKNSPVEQNGSTIAKLSSAPEDKFCACGNVIKQYEEGDDTMEVCEDCK